MNRWSYSVKTVVRGWKRSVLLMILVGLVSALLFIGCTLKWESDRRISEASSAFSVIGLFERENDRVELWEDEYELLKNLEYIQVEEPMILSASSPIIRGEDNPRIGVAYATGCSYSQTEEFNMLFTEEQSVFTFRYIGEGYGENLSLIAGVGEESEEPLLIHNYSSHQVIFEEGETYIAYGRYVPFQCSIEIYEYPYEEYCTVERESERSDAWDEICEMVEQTCFPLTVISTESVEDIYEFHENLAVVQEGESFTDVMYEEGSKVCLIHSKIAKLNDLQVGDEIPLTFYESSYPLGYRWNRAGTMDQGGTEELQQYLSEETYTIAGIYTFLGTDEEIVEYDLNQRTVIVPEKSLNACLGEADSKYKVGKHIEELQYVTIRMQPEDMEQFMKDRSSLVSLQIQLYDQGYSQVKNSLKSFQELANILLSVGVICAALVTCFVGYFEGRARAREQRVYRGLGFSWREIAVRFALSLSLICLPGIISGCLWGRQLSESITAVMDAEEDVQHLYEGIAVLSE